MSRVQPFIIKEPEPLLFHVERPEPVRFEVHRPDPVCFDIKDAAIVQQSEEYKGPVVITPSENEQIIQTENTRLTGNIKVKPIPDNYGRIAWNGSRLRVY